MDNLKGEKMEMEFPGMEEECEGAGRSDMSTGTPQNAVGIEETIPSGEGPTSGRGSPIAHFSGSPPVEGAERKEQKSVRFSRVDLASNKSSPYQTGGGRSWRRRSSAMQLRCFSLDRSIQQMRQAKKVEQLTEVALQKVKKLDLDQ